MSEDLSEWWPLGFRKGEEWSLGVASKWEEEALGLMAGSYSSCTQFSTKCRAFSCPLFLFFFFCHTSGAINRVWDFWDNFLYIVRKYLNLSFEKSLGIPVSKVLKIMWNYLYTSS